jgi:hypothetical protein
MYDNNNSKDHGDPCINCNNFDNTFTYVCMYVCMYVCTTTKNQKITVTHVLTANKLSTNMITTHTHIYIHASAKYSHILYILCVKCKYTHIYTHTCHIPAYILWSPLYNMPLHRTVYVCMNICMYVCMYCI